VEPIFSVAVLCALIIYGGFLWAEKPRRRARSALARARNRHIGDIKDGEPAKVTGVVGVVGPQMTSPIGAEECVGFWLRVEDDASQKVFAKEDCGVFSITDDTGRVNVEGPFLLAFRAENDWSVVPTESFPFLEMNGVGTKGLFQNKSFKFMEALLRRGDRVTVLGRAVVEPDGAPSGSGLRLLVRRMRGSDQSPVIVADADDRLSR
jgi:hypothetical protein